MSHSSARDEGLRRNLTDRDREEFGRELGRVLESETFSSSRRLRGFLAYVGEVALEGRDDVDQYEIAERVLHRDEHFNPLDDASVRKLASQVRHKLEEYYAGEGKSNPVVISLPRRSYVPRFRYRSAESPGQGGVQGAGRKASLANRGLAGRAWRTAGAPALERFMRALGSGWIAATLMTVVAAVLGFTLWRTWEKPLQSVSLTGAASPEAVVIVTQKGDLRGPQLDLAPGAVLLGPQVGANEEVTVKMTFTPSYATHQAGVMVIDTPDRFVRLGRHFKTQAMLEFAQEAGGVYHGPEATYEYDPAGQTGRPIWLSIRRDDTVFRAYTSADGLEWKEFGRPIIAAEPMAAPRAALYGFNGRTDIPSAKAVFENFSVGTAFHNRPQGPWDPTALGGWRVEAACPGEPEAFISGDALTISFSDSAIDCDWRLMRTAPEGDWTLDVLMDFVPVEGSSAGLVARGSTRELRFVRRDLNGGSIMMELDVDSDVSVPDFPGYPLISLRLRARDGILTGAFSKDSVHFHEVPRSVPLSRLGNDVEFGLAAGIAHWSSPGYHPPARFYRVEQPIETVEPLSAQGSKMTSEDVP